MFQVISNGIPGTVMPANGTNGQGVGMTDEEIWQIITYIRSVEVKAPANPAGNAEHGKQLFTARRIARSATRLRARADAWGRSLQPSADRELERRSSIRCAIRAAASRGD